MENRFLQRTWLSPVMAVAFSSVAITGTLMLFHVKVPAMKELHEWMGLVLATAGALHLLVNWRTFWAYFAKRRALVALGAALLLGAVLLASGATSGPERFRGGRPSPAGLTGERGR